MPRGQGEANPPEGPEGRAGREQPSSSEPNRGKKRELSLDQKKELRNKLRRQFRLQKNPEKRKALDVELRRLDTEIAGEKIGQVLPRRVESKLEETNEELDKLTKMVAGIKERNEHALLLVSLKIGKTEQRPRECRVKKRQSLLL